MAHEVPMRMKFVVLPCVVAATALGAQNYVTFREELAQKIFTDSRNAMGGDAAISRLESLVLTGSVTLVPEDGGPRQRDVQIRIWLPDKVIRVESAGRAFERRLGVVGTTVIAGIRTDGGEIETPPPDLHKTMLRSERARLARLLLGMASGVTQAQWLTIATARGVGRMSHPLDGPTGVISDDPDRFRRTLEITGEPAFYARVEYDGRFVPMRLEYPPSKGQTAVMEFIDRRRVDGLLLPFRIVTKVKNRVVEDLRFESIKVNPRLTMEEFIGSK
jgi:hypothetical protein